MGDRQVSTIFVSVASYRDPQMIPTVGDCLAKARSPERLRFGLCWQHGPEELLPCWLSGDQFRVLDVDWRDSRGACWARAEIMGLWSGEDWYLQLDSHHRFAQDWDARLLAQAAASGSARPVLTTYGAPFSPDEANLAGQSTRIDFASFTREGAVLTRPGLIAPSSRPVRARFVSAHFLFAPGSLVEEIPYDPELYFTGEEITVAVRAFTHGYDLFHPGEHILWHEYTRQYRTRHWDDHTEGGVPVAWHERDAVSRRKVGRFFADPFVGRYGLGTARSLADYEAYAGLSFRHRRAQDYTRRNLEPPNPPAGPRWAERVAKRRVEITVDLAELPRAAIDDPSFWYVGFHDHAGRELYRADAGQVELRDLLAVGRERVTLIREFESEAAPVSCTVLPHSASQGWLERLTRTIDAAPQNRDPQPPPSTARSSTRGSAWSEPPGDGPRYGPAKTQPQIFVSVASYRDPQMVPTVEDCLAKARFPERLRFGLCWQHAPDEALPPWFGGDQFRVLDVNWRDSRGPCWARAEIMGLWSGEDWYLQLDSHHRFAQDWDARLLAQTALTPSAKPILSAPAPSFHIGEALSAGAPWLMQFGGFSSDGVPVMKLGLSPDDDSRDLPVRARFICGHFLFAPGSLVDDVPYDPGMYFSKEETTMAVRAFTHGYDLFHPSEVLLWHEYSREYRTKHWEDHTPEVGVPVAWYQRLAESRRKVGRFFADPFVGRYGLGTARSLADYEAYAGLSFRHRRAQDYTRRNLEPPNPPAGPRWAERVADRRVEITVDLAELPRAAIDDPSFWYVGFHDHAGRELYRADAGQAELRDLLAVGRERVTLIREFESEAAPTSWTVLPHSASHGWLEAFSGRAPRTTHGLGVAGAHARSKSGVWPGDLPDPRGPGA